MNIVKILGVIAKVMPVLEKIGGLKGKDKLDRLISELIKETGSLITNKEVSAQLVIVISEIKTLENITKKFD